jgi:phosphate transport system substrate-binding protein
MVSFFTCLFFSCKEKKLKNVPTDTATSGTIHISVDETFQPVITEQIKVFEASYPQANIQVHYRSEADCLKDLENDSIRLVIVAQGLNTQQQTALKKQLSFTPQFDVLAFDAVAVIVNAASPDSVFTLKQLQQWLMADSTSEKEVIVDGSNATSTVRYIADSVLKGKPFGKKVKGTNGSKAVIDYIAAHKNAIGLVGMAWVGNPEDPEQQKYKNKIRLALVECKSCESNIFAKPTPSTITQGQYPLVRPLYYILKENRNGLGSGFVGFMMFERGQLIFKRAYLVPAKMNFQIRNTIIQPDSLTNNKSK